MRFLVAAMGVLIACFVAGTNGAMSSDVRDSASRLSSQSFAVAPFWFVMSFSLH